MLFFHSDLLLATKSTTCKQLNKQLIQKFEYLHACAFREIKFGVFMLGVFKGSSSQEIQELLETWPLRGKEHNLIIKYS